MPHKLVQQLVGDFENVRTTIQSTSSSKKANGGNQSVKWRAAATLWCRSPTATSAADAAPSPAVSTPAAAVERHRRVPDPDPARAASAIHCARVHRTAVTTTTAVDPAVVMARDPVATIIAEAVVVEVATEAEVEVDEEREEARAAARVDAAVEVWIGTRLAADDARIVRVVARSAA